MIRPLALAALAPAALAISGITTTAPVAARESLGVYDGWAAFSDAKPLRCYAIAKVQGKPPAPAYATISNWPGRKVRGALHIMLSRAVPDKAQVRLVVGGSRFTLVAKGRNAWAKDARDDAAIIAALRYAAQMSVSAKATKGGTFTDRYALAGVATAMDAATVGCSGRR